MKNAPLSEAVGLLTDDTTLYEEVPYIKIRYHLWRTLKAKGSEKDILLFGASVWAAKHVNLSLTNVSLRFGLCLLET